MRALAAHASVERRVLRFLNEARTPPEQLIVAPHDRLAIDEETHHTLDHMEHVEGLEPPRLMDRKTAREILTVRHRELPARGFARLRDLATISPHLADLLKKLLASFGPANYGRWGLLYDIDVGGTHIEIEHAALLRTSEVVFLANGTNTLPHMTHTRTYHSSFLLLADGSVLGGGAPPDADPPAIYTPHERFFPGYFDVLRPSITNASAAINYAGTFAVDTPNPADIAEVVLLRPGAVTHGFNQSQRGIECVIAGMGAGSITVESPPNANLAPPGWYLLFVLNAARVPSVGRWIRLTP